MASLSAVGKTSVAPELHRERERSALDLEEITNLVDGGESETERRRRMYALALADPLSRQDESYYWTREEAFDRSTEKFVHFIKKCEELGITSPDDMKYYMRAAGVEGASHESMFVSMIEAQATEQQKAKWMPLIENYDILGTYAQTELGHGTFVRGLETTATFDPTTQDFVLDTPTLTATKFWPRDLGHSTTHAIVLAHLITQGQDHGIHGFIVPLRSLEDHTPLPGRRMGDIGPKFGFFGVENGFLQLSKVRIPRDYMLMRYAQVSPEGVYSKPPSDKITYGTMVWVRSMLVGFAHMALAKAVTIATRYSIVRRQGESVPGGPETQVLDYQTQQFKLLPLVASAYALCFAGLYMMRMHLEFQAEIYGGNLESLPELHATSAGLKALSTDLASNGIEVCRLACGGHGYSLASGLPHLYVQFVPSKTYEGENTVMYLQTARYLHKLFSQQLPSSKLPANIVYLAADYPVLKNCPVRRAEQFMDAHTQLETYCQRARRMVAIAAANYRQAISKGMAQSEAWDCSTVDWTNAAMAHCYYVVLKAFHDVLQSASLSPSNLAIMQSLCALFAVYGIVKFTGDFTTDGYLSSEQVLLAKSQLYSLLRVVRREAVALVDAFDIPDAILNSALGRYDGDVYTHLMDWAQKAPRNKKEVHDVYHKHLKRLLKNKL